MKIVVLDGYTENPGDLSWEELGKLGELTVYDRTSLTDEAEAIARIGDAEIVFTNKTPITRKVLDACPGIRFISLLATGYNCVDYAYAREKGIPVTNVPTYGTASVGQFAIALLLEICHHIGHHDASVHAGNWERCADWCYWDYPLIELAGKTMGIIGFGRIGQTTGRIARAMGMEVLAYDSHPSDAGRAIAEYVDLDALLSRSDVVALHCINSGRGAIPPVEATTHYPTCGWKSSPVFIFYPLDKRSFLACSQTLAMYLVFRTGTGLLPAFRRPPASISSEDDSKSSPRKRCPRGPPAPQRSVCPPPRGA